MLLILEIWAPHSNECKCEPNIHMRERTQTDFDTLLTLPEAEARQT